MSKPTVFCDFLDIDNTGGSAASSDDAPPSKVLSQSTRLMPALNSRI